MEVLSGELNIKSGTLEERDVRTVTSADIRSVIRLTQAAYDALGTKDANTLYVIVGSTVAPTAIPFSSFVPVATVLPFAGASEPEGFLFCDGASHGTGDYPDLFSAVGYAFGGSGSNFNVPDLRGRAPIGVGQGSGLTDRDIGDEVGDETHTLTASEMPTHKHNRGTIRSNASPTNPGTFLASSGTSFFYADNGAGYTNDAFGTQTTGGGNSHNNMQPSLALNFIIKA